MSLNVSRCLNNVSSSVKGIQPIHYYHRERLTSVTWWRHQWKLFPRYWPFVRGIHRSPVNSPHKGQWRGAVMFSLICVWINGWVNNREAGDLRRYRAHYDVSVINAVQSYISLIEFIYLFIHLFILPKGQFQRSRAENILNQDCPHYNRAPLSDGPI